MDKESIYHILQKAADQIILGIGKQIFGLHDLPEDFADIREFDYLGRKFCLEIDYLVLHKSATITTYELVRDEKIRGQINIAPVEHCKIGIGIHDFEGYAITNFFGEEGMAKIDVFVKRMDGYTDRIHNYLKGDPAPTRI